MSKNQAFIVHSVFALMLFRLLFSEAVKLRLISMSLLN